MNVATFAELLSPIGQQALLTAVEFEPTLAKYPACFDRLRKTVSADLARAALDTVLLRQKAVKKFPHAHKLYFTREAYEMSSGAGIARYRAARFASFNTVADLCCGIGGDAMGLAATVHSVIAVDYDPLRVMMTQANLAAMGLQATCIVGDVLTLPLPNVGAAFADPSRRNGERRTLSVADYQPALAALMRRWPTGFPLAVKIAPGVPRDDLVSLDAEVEFISVDGELKECVLWFGPLATAKVRATVLPTGATLTGDPQQRAELGEVQAIVYDPDPSISRSGLVGTLASQLDAIQFDPNIAFLTSDTLQESPFATAYRVVEVLPFHEKKLGMWLRANQIGRVTIVKRGSSADVNELMTKWNLRGDVHRDILLTRVASKAVAIVAKRIADRCDLDL